jgi:transposase
MARFKHYDYRQTKMLPVRFEEQILPGTFEHTLNGLIDKSIDLAVFEARYRNDDGGAPAYDPAILLKIILLAYSRGITSSRQIERLCRENVLFMAMSADSQPHFTTIAHFIATLDRELVLQFPSSVVDFDDLIAVEDELIATLESPAEVDGHDFGSGEGNIFIHTDNPTTTLEAILPVLKELSRDREATIAYRKVEGDEYTAIWPMGLERGFSVA